MFSSTFYPQTMGAAEVLLELIEGNPDAEKIIDRFGGIQEMVEYVRSLREMPLNGPGQENGSYKRRKEG